MRLSILFGFFPSSCAAAAPPPRVTYATPALTNAQNQFAVDLYGQMRRGSGNFFFAPYSIPTALGMVYAGAKANTADEIATALHLQDLTSGGPDDLRVTYLTDFAKQPPFGDTAPDGSKFETANVLWGAGNYRFNRDYIQTIKSDFGGDLRRVDFADSTKAKDGLSAVESDLSSLEINALLTESEYRLVHLTIPQGAWRANTI